MVSLKAVLFVCALAFFTCVGSAPAAEPKQPEVNWGKCPQLKPTEEEKQQKAQVVDQCLDKIPIPDLDHANETVILKHREDVTTCALKAEGWFNKNGHYRFDRAKTEISNKKLPSDIQPQVIAKHDECKKEAEEKFPKNFIAQVQLYQACMDHHISQLCGVKIEGDSHGGHTAGGKKASA
ncbi:uncharacterized protein LOC144162250 [Haemaphysalis longicornis]